MGSTSVYTGSTELAGAVDGSPLWQGGSDVPVSAPTVQVCTRRSSSVESCAASKVAWRSSESSISVGATCAEEGAIL